MTIVSIKGYSVLTEVISPENVQEMAELLTLKETKWLVGKLGEFVSITHRNLYLDVMNKNTRGYALSDSYDLVQTVSVFLCEHFGEYLDDYYYSTKKGKEITLKFHCYHLVNRALCRKHFVQDEKFAASIKSRIGIQADTAKIDVEIDNYESKLNEMELNKSRLERELDSLPVDANHRERKIHDMTIRLDSLYDTISNLSRRRKRLPVKIDKIQLSRIAGRQEVEEIFLNKQLNIETLAVLQRKEG